MIHRVCRKNTLVAASRVKSMNLYVDMLSSFSLDNLLRKLGDINLWFDSKAYNIVKLSHHIWLLSILDYIVENKK